MQKCKEKQRREDKMLVYAVIYILCGLSILIAIMATIIAIATLRKKTSFQQNNAFEMGEQITKDEAKKIIKLVELLGEIYM